MTLRGPLARLRRPRATVRLRLTLLYGGLFLVCGAGLLAITYTLVAHATVTPLPQAIRFVARPSRGPLSPNAVLNPSPKNLKAGAGAQVADAQVDVPGPVRRLLRSSAGRAVLNGAVHGQRISDLHQLEIWSAIALAIMAIISAALGWLVAGRALAPLRTITATTQQISEASLHQRLAMPGPRDELRRLADTIDALLERLEGAFDAQRRFVANASHELRTPLTAARALLEMTISDPHATVETFRETCRQALDEGERQEQLIDSLLALAHGQRGIEQREPIELAALTGEIVRACEPDAVADGLELDVSLTPAVISGDRRLIERLVSNLAENAIRHNAPGGCVRIRVEQRAGGAVFAIANTGPLVPAEAVERLLLPFQRLTADRVGHRDGLGLGLSIVAAIATAHDATLDLRPGEGGGLRVEVSFPTAPGSRQAVTDRTSCSEPASGLARA
jgi:signal transduction histidine kinase